MSVAPRGDVNVAAEVEQLRLHYDRLRLKKQKQEIRKSAVGDATDVQQRLYEEGTKKLLVERIKEQSERRDASSSRRNPSPIPICDRLYEEGMSKVMADKMAESRKLEEQEASNRSRKPSPIPICDRLYEEGMNKVRAGRSTQRDASSTRRRRKSASPIPICDRLYNEGMAKMKSGKIRNKAALDFPAKESNSLPPLV